MRGRKGDSPKNKAAKQSSFRAPDKRKRRKVAMRSAEERAALLASVAGADALAPPEFMAESAEFDGALDVWRQMAPDLQRIAALTNLDRYTLAIYCVHMADWIVATRDIKANGQWHTVKTVSGDKMERLRPAVKIRELAERHIMEIGERFGLNPSARYKMLRDEAIVAGQGNLFAPRDGADAPAASVEKPTSMLARNSSPPPGGTLPN
jgi:P27 family predicted phage terminase small subunit